MPELSRRRSSDAREECWHVFYGDVQVGTISDIEALSQSNTKKAPNDAGALVAGRYLD
jgi:hypothetical protein